MNGKLNPKPIEILLAEDNPKDVRLLIENFWLTIVKLAPGDR